MARRVRSDVRQKPSRRSGGLGDVFHQAASEISSPPCLREFRRKPSSRGNSNPTVRMKESTEADAGSVFTKLPLELYHDIFVRMGPRMVARVLPCVCRKWQAMASDPLLWEALAFRYFNELSERSAKQLAEWKFVMEANAQAPRSAFRMCIEVNGWTTHRSPTIPRRLSWSGASKPRRVQRKEAGKGGSLIARRRAEHVLALKPSRSSVQHIVDTFGVVLQAEESTTGHASTRSQLEGQGFSVPGSAGYLDVYSNYLHVPLVRGVTLEELKGASDGLTGLSECAPIALRFSTALEKAEGSRSIMWKITADASPSDLPLFAVLEAAAGTVPASAPPAVIGPHLEMTLQKYQGWHTLPDRSEVFSRRQLEGTGEDGTFEVLFNRLVFARDRQIHEPALEIRLAGPG